MQPPLAQNQNVAPVFFRWTHQNRLHHAIRLDRISQLLQSVVILYIPRLKRILIDIRNRQIDHQIRWHPRLRLRINSDGLVGCCGESRPRLSRRAQLGW